MNDIASIKKNTARRGVTLVEFLVAFGIFTILITIAGGSFIRSVRIQRVTSQLMEVNDNMGIVIEEMMREMRTGYHFCTAMQEMDYAGITPDVQAQCRGLALSETSTEIQFVNASNETVRYRWKNNALQKGVSRTEYFDPVAAGALCAGGELDAANGVCYQTITAESVKVIGAIMVASFNRDNDGHPPRVTFNFSVTSSDPAVADLVKPITIQTTVSARCGERSCPGDS